MLGTFAASFLVLASVGAAPPTGHSNQDGVELVRLDGLTALVLSDGYVGLARSNGARTIVETLDPDVDGPLTCVIDGVGLDGAALLWAGSAAGGGDGEDEPTGGEPEIITFRECCVLARQTCSPTVVCWVWYDSNGKRNCVFACRDANGGCPPAPQPANN